MKALPIYIPLPQRHLRKEVKSALQAAIISMNLSKEQKDHWLQHIDHTYKVQQAQYYLSYQLERWQKRLQKQVQAYATKASPLKS